MAVLDDIRGGLVLDDKGDVIDVVKPLPVEMRDARRMAEAATLERMGFCLEVNPTACADLRDDAAVVDTYYEEIRNLVKKTSGASRVFVSAAHATAVPDATAPPPALSLALALSKCCWASWLGF